MDRRMEKLKEMISERMVDLYGRYTSERDDDPGREDYYDGMLDAFHDIDEMLDEVFEEAEGLKYCFEYNDGDCGDVEWFDTAEKAIDAAEYKWSHLTCRERRMYTDGRRGGVFMVCFADGVGIRNWADEEEEE